MKKIGMRNIKTGIAVFLATLASFSGIVQTPVYTVSVCIFSLKNTIKGTLEDAFSRILGTVLGGIIGFVFALITGGNMIWTSLGVMFVIHLCKILKISDSAGIASVTFASILLGVGKNDPLMYSLMRTIDTLVGVLIALLVNYWVSRRKYLKYLCKEFNATNADIVALIGHMVKRGEYSRYSDLEERFDLLKMYYNQLIDEVIYSNETGDLGNMKKSFDVCEQLLHHTHGLYLLEKNLLLNESIESDAIYRYHIYNISELLLCSEETEVNLDRMLDEKTA